MGFGSCVAACWHIKHCIIKYLRGSNLTPYLPDLKDHRGLWMTCIGPAADTDTDAFGLRGCAVSRWGLPSPGFLYKSGISQPIIIRKSPAAGVPCSVPVPASPSSSSLGKWLATTSQSSSLCSWPFPPDGDPPGPWPCRMRSAMCARSTTGICSTGSTMWGSSAPARWPPCAAIP